MALYVPPSLSLFVNNRCTFQRLKDARILHGWIEAIDSSALTVRFKRTTAVHPSEQFHFHAFGLREDATFLASLSIALAEDAPGTTCVEGLETAMFRIDSNAKFIASTGAGRLLVKGFNAEAGAEVDREWLSGPVLDVSRRGMAAVFNRELPVGAEASLKVTSPKGPFEIMATVRNVRPSLNGDTYRHGFELNTMNRLDDRRWNELFEFAA